METGLEKDIAEQVRDAVENQSPLNIVGGNTKSFYGREPQGKALHLNQHYGIVSYEPTELVITARSGTKIHEIQALLAENNQMLGFEPSLCSADSTLGGVVAAGLAGCGRAYAGGVRDFILGVKMINGEAEVLKFGGQVMKNVAGFDHSRLMAGSLGTLGVLLEISLRVLPLPKCVATVKFAHADPDESIEFMNRLSGQPFPISAAAWLDGQTRIRLSGTQEGVCNAINSINADTDDQAVEFWAQLDNQQLDLFQNQAILYRVSTPAAVSSFCDAERQLIDWGGAQRWFVNVEDPDSLKRRALANSATVSIFRGGDRQAEVFHPLDAIKLKLHQNIKQAFDPNHLFNPGRMYKDL